ncbi:M20/M25/M40 family metallo-hydrolase [Elioraea sp.]|uniref:M20/M25/M40 family metallo-hydrolase n=1 Tax=Elioraea sp. TaxID=2185103 RepID=UPI003F7182EA
MTIEAQRAQLLRWIEAETPDLIDVLARFARAASPNPPGDTREATGVLASRLEQAGQSYCTVALLAHAPNLIATIEGGHPGKHLVLNGHIDVFPCDDAHRWNHDPWGGAVVDGRVYGRGVSDMKNGTVALLFAHIWLARLADTLPGRVTLTAVSDEETGGTWGAQYLVDRHPEVLGDCLLNAEPGAPTTIRFGEKGILRLAVTVRTPGCHGAYTHKSPSATRIAARLVAALDAVTELPVAMEPEVARALDEGAAEMDRIHLPGAARVMRQFSLNLGVVRGGTKVNMLPGECRLEFDVRIPPGERSGTVMAEIERILAAFPEATLEVTGLSEPTWSSPKHPMVTALAEACSATCGFRPRAIASLAATDARKWRAKGVPAFTYGTTATNVAMPDEHTDIAEWLGVVKTLTLGAHAWLHAEAGR